MLYNVVAANFGIWWQFGICKISKLKQTFQKATSFEKRTKTLKSF